ncbi:MAG: SBBP repeat-containing protein [Deltaproteobacteria bacterium]|nr:SBBP repeat-containing protein [Deltaproteobacteria bacterium]
MERAQFNWPAGIAVDDNGNIYVADSGNNRVRKISQGGGILQAKLFLP